jgi:hypothetical protein
MTRAHYSLIVALLCLSGCQGWHQVARPSAGGSLEGNPDIVRVTRTVGCGATPTRECVASHGTVTLYNPRVKGDSLIGYYDSNQRLLKGRQLRLGQISDRLRQNQPLLRP